jgi:hypothetical protein
METKKIFIEYNNKEYEITKPTLRMWSKLQLYQQIEDEKQFMVSLISIATGLTDAEIREADWQSILTASQFLSTFFLDYEEKFYPEFEFKGVKYKFIDLNSLSFGEFIDIDEFLSKDESYRRGNMNMLMALLYREVDENGVITKYNSGKVKERAQLFFDLELKYLQGALLFFLILETTLQGHTRFSFLQMVRKMWLKVKRVFHNIGDGMGRWFFWRQRILPN